MITALVVVSVALALTTLKLLQTLRRLSQIEHGEHAKCIAHIAHYVGDSFAAQVLEAAADDYDTALGRQQLSHLASVVRIEGQSIPATWLRHRAQGMKPVQIEEVA